MNGPSHVTPADGNIFADLGFQEPEASQLLAQADARLHCKINRISSRTCEKGTKGCVISHGEDDGKEYKKA